MLTILLTYFTGCFFYFFADNINQDYDTKARNTFITYYDLDSKEINDRYRLLSTSYFAITTLSTVGYGDFYPISNVEKLFVISLMFGGITFFSYVLGSFI